MTVVFGGVLLCSFAIERLFSPAGDAVLHAIETRQVNITGFIAACPSEPGRLAIVDGTRWYILADQTQARLFAGHKVRIVGIVHPCTGLLDIRRIDSADTPRV
jgi:hypothetical protein